jgi:hypothetical protein
MSSAFKNPIISPVDILKPLFKALACPRSFSEMKYFICDLYFSITSIVPSVLPPSIIIYSRFG